MQEIIYPIGNGIDLVTIQEPRFKTTALMAVLLVPVIPEKNAAYTLAHSLLAQSCRKYPDNKSMTIRLDELYGASMSSSTGVGGNVMQLILTVSGIADRFALDGKPVLPELTQILLDCLLDPNAGNGAFSEREFAIQRQELYDAIQAEINNKRGYAITRARRTAFEGEPDAYPSSGTKEDVDALTPENTFAAYQELLRRSVIRIYCCSPEDAGETLAAQLRAAFAGLERAPEPLEFYAPSSLHENAPVTVREPMDVTQSRLVMIFKETGLSKEQLRLFSAIFGGVPFSVLFANVREKLSLCYYCASRPLVTKDALIVDSGVELANAEKTRDAVLHELERLREGDFEDELLDNAKLAFTNALRAVGDTPYSCISEFFERYVMQDDAGPEERIRRIEALTREDIIAAAKALTLDTVYLMEQGGGTEE